MKYLLAILLLISPVYSELVPGSALDTLLRNIFVANGYTWPHPQDSDFVLTFYGPSLLTGLTIKNHNFTTFSPDILKLLSLNYLDLTGNSLTSIPAEITLMVNLRQFRVDSNQLAQLPSSIGTMTWLTYLGASHNQIVGFNAAMFANTSFQAQVAFSYNRLGCPPNQTWITTSQRNYLNTHDVNPDWASTQDCNPVANAVQTAPGAFRMAFSPNPFTTTTTLQYDLPGASNRVFLAIYDISGALVKTLLDGTQGQGHFSANFEGARSGIYFSRAVVNGRVYTQRLLMAK